MRLRKIGAVLAGAAMLGATLAGAVTAGDQPAHSFWINDDGTPAAMIVVGDSAAASDVVSASLIAAKIGSMAVKTEEMNAPAVVYWDKATDIPLAYSIPSWEMTIPWFAYNIPGSAEETAYQFYKTWGVTTMWTPNSGGYIPLVYNDVRINYTIGGLWFYDEDSRTWYFTHPDGAFSPWETHEEIQLRFDDLYLVGGKEYQLSGYPFQDHNADLAGGDIVPQSWPILEGELMVPPAMTADIPGLIYRIDNIRRPRQEEDAGYSLYFKWDNGEVPGGMPWVDTQQLLSSYYYTPDFQSIQRQRIPRIFVFGKEYKVVDATFLWSRDNRYRTQDADWSLGGKYGYVIITGEPAYYLEQYVYKDSPVTLDGFEINVKDVDVDHNKVYIGFTDPAGDTQDFWMVLDPMHGFSATPQLMSQTGEATEYNGMSMWDVYFWGNVIQWRDNAGHAHYQYDYPTFMLDGIMTFVGAGGTIGAMFNAYTLSDVQEWKSQLCCIPFVEEPNNYSLWIDQQRTIDPCIGSYFSYHVVATGTPGPLDVAAGNPSGFEILPDPDTSVPYLGPIWSIDGHCIPYLGTEPLLPPRTDQFGDIYSYTHFIESVPNRYMDRDPNDYLWLYEDGFRARKQSHFEPDWYNCWTAEGCDPSVIFNEGGDYQPMNGDYMWEMNFALCDVIESVKCTTKWVIQGPNNYFRIEMEDITWDDNANGWPYLQTNRVWAADGSDDGIDFKVIMEVSSGTYKQTTSVPLDPTSIVKLDVEVTDDDMGAFNLVLVGGPVANILVKKLVDMGKTPDDGSAADWAVTSPGDYKLYTNGFDMSKDVLVVAGANREETRKAAEELVAGMG